MKHAGDPEESLCKKTGIWYINRFFKKNRLSFKFKVDMVPSRVEIEMKKYSRFEDFEIGSTLRTLKIRYIEKMNSDEKKYSAYDLEGTIIRRRSPEEIKKILEKPIPVLEKPQKKKRQRRPFWKTRGGRNKITKENKRRR